MGIAKCLGTEGNGQKVDSIVLSKADLGVLVKNGLRNIESLADRASDQVLIQNQEDLLNDMSAQVVKTLSLLKMLKSITSNQSFPSQDLTRGITSSNGCSVKSRV